MTRRTSLALLTTLAVCLATSPSTRAQTLFEGSAPRDAVGSVLAWVGDVDGDGTDDLIAGLPGATRSGLEGSGAVQVRSGADGTLIWERHGFERQDALASTVTGLGDVTGDGVPDVAAAALRDAASPSGEQRFYAATYTRVLSGADGAHHLLLQSEPLSEPYTRGQMGRGLDALHDVDGDGVPDLLIGEGQAEAQNKPAAQSQAGRGLVVSGADGRILRVHEGQALGSIYTFGVDTDVVGDVDGDLVDDYAVSSTFFGRTMFSGADGQVLWVDNSSPSGMAAVGDLNLDGVPDLAVLGGGARIRHGATGDLITSFGVGTGANRIANLGDLNGDGFPDVALGEPTAATTAGADAGRVLVYSGREGLLLEIIDGTQAGGRFGTELLVRHDPEGPTLLVGEPGHDGVAGLDAGRVVAVQPGSLVTLPLITGLAGATTDTVFPSVLALPGDVDNDGHDDLLVGDYLFGDFPVYVGRVVALSGRDASVLLALTGPAELDRFGYAVSAVGDVDRDGHDDLAASSPFPGSLPAPGRVELRSGDDGGLLVTAHGASANDQFGAGLAALGDLDGDGSPDLIVGAPFDDVGGPNVGAVRVISGADGGVLLEVTGSQANAGFGSVVAGPGDVTGDGLPDIAVASPDHDFGGASSVGRLQVFSGADGAPVFSRMGLVAFDRLGAALAPAGDVDGDGRGDLVVGEPGHDGGAIGGGRVLVLSGADGAVLAERVGDLAGGDLGSTVGRLGDVTGDGFPEVVCGQRDRLQDGDSRGLVTIWDPTGDDVVFTLGGEQDGQQFALSLAGGSDIDNDGGPDLVLGVAASGLLSLTSGGLVVINPATSGSPWQSAGERLPGATTTPELAGAGPLEAGTPVSLDLSDGPPFAVTGLVAGLQSLSIGFKGGVLVPAPDLLFTGLALSGDGGLVLASTWPAGVPSGVATWYQAWLVDATGPVGFSASNAVTATTP